MKIIKTFNWNRRDFSFVAKCENCQHEETHNAGYDDSNYYNNVIPSLECSNCKKSSNDLPKNESIPETKIIPKYNPNIQM